MRNGSKHQLFVHHASDPVATPSSVFDGSIGAGKREGFRFGLGKRMDRRFLGGEMMVVGVLGLILVHAVNLGEGEF